MKEKIAIVSLKGSVLANNIAKQLKVDLMEIDFKQFPSNEFYLRLNESVRGKDVFIVHSMGSQVSDELMSLFILIDCLKRSFAKQIHIFLPYFPYARQDRVSLPREPISAKLLANLFDAAGSDHVIACELHSPQIQGFFNKPMDNIDLVSLFESHFTSQDLTDTVMVAVDVGGAKLVKTLADRLGLPMVIMHKVRPSQNEASIQEVVGNVSGKNCIMFDDMVDTGGSVMKAFDALQERGANKITLAAVHPVLSNNAMEKLVNHGFAEIVFANTLDLDNNDKKVSVLDISSKIAMVFRQIANNESVTQILYE